MRRLVVIALAALSVAVVAAPSASARHTLGHRVSALETKVRTLQAQTRTLRTRLTDLTRFTEGCLAWRVAGLAAYGDANGAFGYSFDNDGAGPGPAMYATALDFAESAQDVDIFVPAVNPQCLTSGRIAAGRVALTYETIDVSRPARLH